jgi:DNA-binding LacI/PurR family transcriptional regulator
LGVPAILIGAQANTGFPLIRTDNRKAGFEATRYLWSLGHRRFIYLTSLRSWHDFHQRGQGMKAFLKQTAEPYDLAVHDHLFTEEDAYRQVTELCANGLEATAILASTDRHALGALAALADARLKVPRDASVMGFDDYKTSSFIRPSLTTMQMPSAEMGSRAVSALRQQIDGLTVDPLPPLRATLVIRGSTGPARA